jgi:hypothetical protein
MKNIIRIKEPRIIGLYTESCGVYDAYNHGATYGLQISTRVYIHGLHYIWDIKYALCTDICQSICQSICRRINRQIRWSTGSCKQAMALTKPHLLPRNPYRNLKAEPRNFKELNVHEFGFWERSQPRE